MQIDSLCEPENTWSDVDVPIDDYTINSIVGFAKKTMQKENFRNENICSNEENIIKFLTEGIIENKISFFTTGNIRIQSDITLNDLGVHISGRTRPIQHRILQRFCYDSYVTVESSSGADIRSAFNRVDKALDIVSAANFGADLAYYINIPHVNLFLCDELPAERTHQNINLITELISKLGPSYKAGFENMFSLLRMSQKTSSPFESFLMTWNATDVVCSLCDKIFKLRKKEDDDLDIAAIINAVKPTTINQAKQVLNNLEDNNTQKKWERVFRYIFREHLDYAESLLDMCFRRTPPSSRLYNIRNKIAHGGILKSKIDYWEICYRLSELNEFAPAFALLSPFDKNVMKKKTTPNESTANADNTVILLGHVLDAQGLPCEGDVVTVTQTSINQAQQR